MKKIWVTLWTRGVLAIGALLIYFVLRFIPHFGDISIAFLAVYGFAIVDLAFWNKDNNQETKK